MGQESKKGESWSAGWAQQVGMLVALEEQSSAVLKANAKSDPADVACAHGLSPSPSKRGAGGRKQLALAGTTGAAGASQQETGLRQKQELTWEGAPAALPRQAGPWAVAAIWGSLVTPGASGQAPVGAREPFRPGLTLSNTRTQRFFLLPMSCYPGTSLSTGASCSWCC